MTWGITKFAGNEFVSRDSVNSRIQQINSLFPVPINKGGTGATTIEAARANFSLGSQVVLYHNISGTSGTVTLAQQASSCNRWGIYYGYSNIGGYQEIDTDSDNSLNIYMTYLSVSNNLYTRSALAAINKSSRTITLSRNKTFIIYNNGTRARTDDGLSIYHVIGYI